MRNPIRSRRARRLLPSALAALALAGCAVGPDFKPPNVPPAAGTTAEMVQTTADAPTRDGAAQRFVVGQDIAATWWALFRSPALNALIDTAIRNNPGIDGAQAALRQARELTRAQQGAFFPSVAGSLGAQRAQTPASLAPNTASGASVYNLYTAQVSVSYAPDVFGLNRRTVENLDALAEQQRWELEAAYLTLTSNIVNAAVQEAYLGALVAA